MKIIPLENIPFYQSNSQNLGIQTFTSFLSGKEQFIFLDDHLERLLKGADYLYPKELWPSKKSEIKDFLAKEFVPSHYFRLTIFEGNLLFFKKPHEIKDPHLSLAKAKSAKVTSIIPSFVKNSHYLLSTIEIQEAKKRKLDDVLFFDQQGNATEASTSNIFVVLNENEILTPKTSSMVLEGVTRKKLIEFLKLEKYTVIESDISQSEMESAREIWLTNAIQGVRLVDRFEKLELYKDKTIYQSIVMKFGRFGEKFNHE